MLSQTEFINAYGNAGAKKAASPALRLFLLGILAGFEIACGGALSTIASFSAGSASIVKTLASFTFPLALTMVIWTGAELFTGNCLITISVLDKKASLGGMLRNWCIVYVGNLVGSLILAFCLANFKQIGLGGGALATSIISTAVNKCSYGFGDAFVRGIGCNILVCIAIMAATSAKDAVGKFISAVVPVAAFVMLGFEHSIANMYYIPTGLFAMGVPAYAEAANAAGLNTAALTWGAFFVKNLLPVTLGNIIGGAGFGALMWFAHGDRSSK